MLGSDVIEYVRKQLKSGYSVEEIKAALLSQGWVEEEVTEALHEADASPGVYPPVKIKKGKKGGFIISLIGGLLLFVFGLETILSLPLLTGPLQDAGLNIEFFGYFAVMLQTELTIGTVILIFAIVTILGSFLVNREGKEKLGGILVLVFSVILLVGFNGFLLFIGAVLGIIGGILGIKRGF